MLDWLGSMLAAVVSAGGLDHKPDVQTRLDQLIGNRGDYGK